MFVEERVVENGKALGAHGKSTVAPPFRPTNRPFGGGSHSRAAG